MSENTNPEQEQDDTEAEVVAHSENDGFEPEVPGCIVNGSSAL
ncbi:hypothetical protein [Streptomyces sp. NBC_01013]|nr:hypothetical protein OG538_33640 [Streptomyces sp. NBC_01013]